MKTDVSDKLFHVVKLIIGVTLKVMAKEFLKCRAPNHPYTVPVWTKKKKKVASNARGDQFLTLRELNIQKDSKSWDTPFRYVLSEEVVIWSLYEGLKVGVACRAGELLQPPHWSWTGRRLLALWRR